MKNALLLENRYKKKYRNLGLMKFSTHFKNLGYEVDYYTGIDKKNTLKSEYEYIIYSTIFTFYFNEDIITINYYKDKYPNAKILVGGVSATLLADDFCENTGIAPHKGIYDEVESLCPDYELFPDHYMKDTSEVFTARGCKNNCGFCAVKTLEPNYLTNHHWKDSVDLSKRKIMIHDNNLTTSDFEHFKEVIDYVKENKLWVTFDNGFDCRNFNDKHLELIKDMKFLKNGLRFAFDNMGEDGHIQKAIENCLKAGVPKTKIMIYVLFNYTDTFDEAMYRANEMKRLGVRPYPQQYRPLDDKELRNKYISKNWTKKLLEDFRFYWMMPGIYTKQNWDDYVNRGGASYYKTKKEVKQ